MMPKILHLGYRDCVGDDGGWFKSQCEKLKSVAVKIAFIDYMAFFTIMQLVLLIKERGHGREGKTCL